VVETGLLHDRKWMIIDEDGQFLSQRRLPEMALIKPALNGNTLLLSAPGMVDISTSFEPSGEIKEIVKGMIWKDLCDVDHPSVILDEWLSDFLKRDCRLVRQLDNVKRNVDPSYGLLSDQVAFSDGFPFLIISEGSLESLNNEMEMKLTMARFRPNLVISGCSSYAEDTWREIRIGNIDFRLPKPCSRCVVPSIDPDTARIGKEPLPTLNRLRRWQSKVYFGQNALHNQCGRLSIGDQVMILKSGEKQPPI
jgi:uncharacterized protein